MKWKALIFAGLTWASLAGAAEPWEGTYRWDNKGQESQHGNVFQYVSLRVAIGADGKLVLSCGVFWKPGMDADFGAVVEPSLVEQRTLEDGTTATVIPFTFEDSNENKGTGEVEIRGLFATLKIVNTDIIFAPAARQYGTYQLRKE